MEFVSDAKYEAGDESDAARLVGSDRVLAVLIELAQHPAGASLDELAIALRSPKSTVHRALASLRRARLAAQSGRGIYVLGDEFIRLAYVNQSLRPEVAFIEPVLRQLAEIYGETTHYAVLDRSEVVYRAKIDPPVGGVRLTSFVGGRNPAHRTAVGKLLLSFAVTSRKGLAEWLGDERLEPRTPKSIVDVDRLWEELERTQVRGFAVDDEENEIGINCVAVPVRLNPALAPIGAVSISALRFRMPLERLIEQIPRITAVVEGSDGSRLNPLGA